MRTFLPSARATNWLLLIGFAALGYAFYMRYLVIEQSTVSLACEAGLKSWSCQGRMVVMAFYKNQVFGWIGIGAAILNLIRPSLLLFAIGLAATCLGLVLYNAGLAGLAGAILVMSFARPVVEQE
jgi:hypothetical protein